MKSAFPKAACISFASFLRIKRPFAFEFTVLERAIVRVAILHMFKALPVKLAIAKFAYIPVKRVATSRSIVVLYIVTIEIGSIAVHDAVFPLTFISLTARPRVRTIPVHFQYVQISNSQILPHTHT